MTDKHDRPTVNSPDSADNRGIVRKHPVAVKFLKIRCDAVEIIKRVWPTRMPRDLRHLPRRQFGKNAPRQGLAFLTQPRDFVVDVHFRIITDETQFFDLRLKLGDRLLKIEKFHVHYE